MQKGKTGASDGVLAEFLQALKPDQIGDLHTLLVAALAGGVPAPDSWREASVTLIPKIEKAILAADFRRTTILPVLQKLALKMWMAEAGPHVALRRHTSHGFRAHLQAAELHHIFRTLVERRSEWDLPTFMSKLDMRKAYDTVAWCAIDWLFERGQLPMHLQCAYWRMHCGRVLHFHTVDGTIHFSVAPTGGMPQGARDPPLGYAALVEEFLDLVDAHLLVNDLPAGLQINADCSRTLSLSYY